MVAIKLSSTPLISSVSVVPLSANKGTCLKDKHNQRSYYAQVMNSQTKLPGEVYTPNEQCELSFGRGARLCNHMFVQVGVSSVLHTDCFLEKEHR